MNGELPLTKHSCLGPTSSYLWLIPCHSYNARNPLGAIWSHHRSARLSCPADRVLTQIPRKANAFKDHAGSGVPIKSSGERWAEEIRCNRISSILTWLSVALACGCLVLGVILFDGKGIYAGAAAFSGVIWFVADPYSRADRLAARIEAWLSEPPSR